MTALTVTLGAGHSRPQGRRVAISNARELREQISALGEKEGWFCLHEFRGDYRRGDNWLSAAGVGIDVDYYDGNGTHATASAEGLAKVDAASRELGASLYYRTPRGARFVFLFDAQESDRARWQLAGQALAARVAGVLGASGLSRVGMGGGFEVDTKVTGDCARCFCAPNVEVKGVQRRAEVLSNEHFSTASVLAASARLPRQSSAPGPSREAVLDKGEKLQRAARYLARIAGAVEYQGGHDQTWSAALAVVRGFDLDPDSSYDLLATEYNPRCVPPWSEKELRHKIRDAAEKSDLPRGYLLESPRTRRAEGGVPIASPGVAVDIRLVKQTERERRQEPPPLGDEYSPPGRSAPEALTETSMAEALVKRHGRELRHVGEWNKWLVWDGKRWRDNRDSRVQRLVKETIRTLRGEAERANDRDRTTILFKAEKRSTRESVEVLARHELAVQVETARLDVDPYLLNVRNGTIDLRTGQLRPHRHEDLITKLAPVDYDPTAECPRWLAFLDRIFAGNTELIGYVQRAVGYSLTGDTGEHCLFILFGSGRNGKSTLVETLLAVLGDYGKPGVGDLLLEKHHEKHETELADLLGARLVTFQETKQGRRFDESKVKALTGGDTIKARRMREDFWEFSPTHKLWLGTNHRPAISGTDLAIWSHIRLIPFLETIPAEERDKQLKRKLLRERSGILRWGVEGCLAWQRDGLQEPSAVREATDDYQRDEDTLALFLADCCIVGKGQQVDFAPLYECYKRWSQQGGTHPLSAKAFAQELTTRGFEGGKAGNEKRKIRKGIGLLRVSEAEMRTDAGTSPDLPLTRAHMGSEPDNLPASVRNGDSPGSRVAMDAHGFWVRT